MLFRSLFIKSPILVWFGHSSYLIQTGGKRILVDPVFCMASPVSFVNKPFKGTELYTPDDMPDIDYLVISHDHWDHLDYNTVKKLKDRIGAVICPNHTNISSLRSILRKSVFIALTACLGRKPSIFLKMNSQIPLKRPLSEVINRVSC